MHQRKGAATYAAHGGRTIGFQYIRNYPDGIRELLFIGYNRYQSSFSQGPMTYLPAAWAAHRFGFSRAVRREIIMVDITFRFFNTQSIQTLFLTHGAQGGNRKDLGLSAGEQSGAMRTRQIAHFTAYLSDFIQLASVNPFAFLQHHLAHDLFQHSIQLSADGFLIIGIAFGKMLQGKVVNIINMTFPFQFVRIFNRLNQLIPGKIMDQLLQFFIGLFFCNCHFNRRCFGINRLLEFDYSLNFIMGKEDGIRHDFFRYFVGTALHHQNSFLAAGHG